MGKNRKHSIEFRLGLIKASLNGTPVKRLAKQNGISDSLLRKWVDAHRISGRQGLLPHYGQHYPADFKLRTVRACLDEGLSLRDCCLHYQIPSQGTLSRWINQHKQFGQDCFISKARGRPRSMKNKAKIKTNGPLTRLEELENENLRLRAENELLKKLDALIRHKEATQKKRR